MTHFAKARTTWIDGDEPDAAEILVLSGNAAAAINAVRGGAWAPTSLLAIGGAGLTLNGPLVVYGADGSLASTSGSRFILGDGDWPQMAPGHPMMKQRRVTSVLKGTPVPYYAARARLDLGGMQFNALGFVQGPGGVPFVYGPPSILVPLEILDHAQLTQATLSFAVMRPRTTVPIATPKLRIVAIDASGNVTPLTSVAAGADANGYVSVVTPKNAGGWYASAGTQTLVIPLDVTHITDLSAFSYSAEVIEETGTGSWPWTVPVSPGVDYVYTTNQAQTANLSGARVLCAGQTTPSQNGIFIGTGGAWTRAIDLFTFGGALPLAFTQGLIVPVNSNTNTPDNYGPSVYQLLNQGAVAPGTDPLSFAAEAATPLNVPGNDFSPVGNLYTTVAIDMTVTDFRYGQS